MTPLRSLCAVAFALALAACKGPPPTVSDVACKTQVELGAVVTDILFVIDNSGSMKEEQELLSRELSAFVDRVKNSPLRQDFQVGVITTSVYLRVQNQPTVFFDRDGFLGPAQAGRLQTSDRGDGTFTPKLMRYDAPDFLSDFSLAVKVGTSGSGQETHFEPARLAISAPLIELPLDQGGNQGLLRNGARLMIVAVTDEDDCSEFPEANGTASYDATVGPLASVDYCDNQSALLTKVPVYADKLRELAFAAGASEVMFAAIAPVDVAPPHEAVQDPSTTDVRARGCTTSYGVGRRLREMALNFDSSGLNLDSVCNPSFQDTLVRLADEVRTPQTIDLAVPPPDGRMLIAEITRATGDINRCSMANGGLLYSAPREDAPARITFREDCRRRADDARIDLKLICVD